MLAHNELVESEYGTGLDGLTDDPEWGLLDEDIVSIPFLQIALTLVLSMVLFYAMYCSMPKESVTITSSRLQTVSLLSFAIGFYVLVIVLRDTSEFVSGRWLRKSSERLRFSWSTTSLSTRTSAMVPMFIIGILMLMFFYPELRFSMIIAATAPLALYLLNQSKEQFTPPERWLLNVFFFLCFYQLIDYIPRFFSGLSSMVNIDLLYKPMQRIVLSSMPSSPISSFILVTIFSLSLFVNREEDQVQVEWNGISVMCLIFGLTVLQTTWIDLVLIGLMLMCAVTSLIPAHAMVCEHLSMQPSEIILIIWVGATWGSQHSHLII